VCVCVCVHWQQMSYQQFQSVAPPPQVMQFPPGAAALGALPGHVFVRQTRKGCLQNFLGCDANEEFQLGVRDNPKQTILYGLENTGCCVRFCCGNNRPMHLDVSVGDQKGGAPVVHLDRPLRCHSYGHKCCCLQEMQVSDGVSRNPLGKAMENVCWCFVPKFTTYRPDGTPEHLVSYPVCMGCCPNCCAEGCCRVPFYVFPWDSKGPFDKEHKLGHLTKVWTGWANAFFNAHTFEVDFPSDANAETRARLLAALFLVNQTHFQMDSSQSGDAGAAFGNP